MTSWRGALSSAALALLATTSCASSSERAAEEAFAALSPPTTGPVATAAPPAAPACEPRASFRPTEPVPAPNEMPAGTFMHTILERGYLVVGVDENTLYFSSRNPATNEIEGFEADLARELARAIFGDPEKVRFTSVVTAEKVDVVESGLVDATISVVSASCERWQHVAFSTTYYEASQRVLVRVGSPIRRAADLAGRTVCVTLGSSSERYLTDELRGASSLPVEARTDCLVALQEGRADAVLLPDSILAGLHAQDATTEILPGDLRTQSYAIPIAREHPDFVRFVNALVERWRTDGTLAALHEKWFAPAPELRTDPVAPAPMYLD
jgi:polar amino acid transport system substrate-binding protein